MIADRFAGAVGQPAHLLCRSRLRNGDRDMHPLVLTQHRDVTDVVAQVASNGGNVTFDTGQIQTITLWNPDLTYNGYTQEVFGWNGTTYTFQNYI